MSDPRPQHLEIRLNALGVIAPMELSARQVARAVKCFLPAIDKYDFAESVLIGPPQAVFDFPPLSDVSESQALQDWLTAALLQELSRGLRRTLEEAYVFAKILTLDGRVFPLSELDSIREASLKMNAPSLLRAVNLTLREPLLFFEEIEALNAARNCLEHGRGVVRHRDCADGESALKLKMPYFALCIVGDDGLERDLEFGVPVAAETPIGIARRTHVFEYRVGERLVLTASQVEAIAIGCILFSKDVAGKLPTKGPAS